MEPEQATEKCENFANTMKSNGPPSVSPSADEGVSVDTETTDRTDCNDSANDDSDVADGDEEFDFSDSDLEDLDNETEKSTFGDSQPVVSEDNGPKTVLKISCDTLHVKNNNNNNECGLDDNNLVIEAQNQTAVTTMIDNATVYETVNPTLVDQFSPNTKKSLENIADTFFDKAQHNQSASAQHLRRRSFCDRNYQDEASSDEDDGIIHDFLGKSNDLVCDMNSNLKSFSGDGFMGLSILCVTHFIYWFISQNIG
jgi:hypothetical protein